MHIRYLYWMEGLLKGDLVIRWSISDQFRIDRRTVVLTLFLALFAFAITWIVAVPAVFIPPHIRTRSSTMPLRC